VQPPHASDPLQQNGESDFYVPAVRALTQTADQLREADRRVIDWVRERPLASLAIAVAAGYFVGRAFSRWG
jgi:hypothetical protein